jgi:hypothetical protein
MDAISRNVASRYAMAPPTRATAAARGPVWTGSGAAPAWQAAAGPAKVDAVETSGRAIMISRLFHAAPESLYLTPETAGSSGSTYSFLTREDRDAISALYEVAQANGTNLREIDAIAFDLGAYRSTRPEIVRPSPVRFEADGTPRPAAFSTEDEATAQRLLTSKALTTSALPADFLRARLDPALSEGHATNLGVLERLVYATSPDGDARDTGARVPPRPSDYFAEALAEFQAAMAAEPNGEPGRSARLQDEPVMGNQLQRALQARHLDAVSMLIAQWSADRGGQDLPTDRSWLA